MMPFSNITSQTGVVVNMCESQLPSGQPRSFHRGWSEWFFSWRFGASWRRTRSLPGGDEGHWHPSRTANRWEKWEISFVFQGPLAEMGFCWSLLCLEWFTWNKCILEAKSDSSWYQKFEARNFWMFCEVSFVLALRQLRCQNYEGWVSPFCWRQVQEPLQDFQMRTTRGGRFFFVYGWKLEAADWHIVKSRDAESQARRCASRWIFCRSVEASWYHLQGEWAALGRGGTEKTCVTTVPCPRFARGSRRNWSDIVRQQHLLNIKRKPGEMLFECGWVKWPGADASGDSNVAEPRCLWFFFAAMGHDCKMNCQKFPCKFPWCGFWI